MGVVSTAEPEFLIEGDSTGIRGRTAIMRTRSGQFRTIADTLESISTDGWTGRAADRFRERFTAEPDRWREAAAGFDQAASALDTYADALDVARGTASDCRAEYERGQQVSEDARARYDAEVQAARQEQRGWEATYGPGTYTLAVVPFTDPGATIRSAAVAAFHTAVDALDQDAQLAADAIRGSCQGAPEKRGWLRTGLEFVGGVFVGLGEALWDIVQLATPQMAAVEVLMDLATGRLTPEEAAAKLKLPLESAQAMLDALIADPLEFGKSLGKGLLDWDTWADDPARAIGHLVPDVVAAVFTGGAGTAATKSAGLLERLGTKADDLVDGLRALDRVDDVADGARGIRRLEGIDVTDIPHAPADLGGGALGREAWEASVDSWADGVVAAHPQLARGEVKGLYTYTTNEGYTAMNGFLRNGTPLDGPMQTHLDGAVDGLNRLPRVEDTTYRGTRLPQSVVDDMLETKTFRDDAFLSSSFKPDTAADFAAGGNPANPSVIFEIEGRTGVDVSPFSAYGTGEAEVLFKPGTPFTIGSMERDASGVWHATMREQ